VTRAPGDFEIGVAPQPPPQIPLSEWIEQTIRFHEKHPTISQDTSCQVGDLNVVFLDHKDVGRCRISRASPLAALSARAATS